MDSPGLYNPMFGLKADASKPYIIPDTMAGGFVHPAEPPKDKDVTPEVTKPYDPLRGVLGLVTPDELAEALSLQEGTLSVWRSKGEGPAYIKLGKQVFYRLQDLDFWVGTKFPEKVMQPPVVIPPLAGVDDADAEAPEVSVPKGVQNPYPTGWKTDSIPSY